MQGKSLPQTRRAVLGLVLHEHPREVSPVDLRRDFGNEAAQAIADLIEDELLARRGESIRPTRPAVSFYRLEFP
jgi:hypothetical protein